METPTPEAAILGPTVSLRTLKKEKEILFWPPLPTTYFDRNPRLDFYGGNSRQILLFFSYLIVKSNYTGGSTVNGGHFEIRFAETLFFFS